MNIFTERLDKKTPVLKAAVNLLLLAMLILGFVWFTLYRTGLALGFTFLLDLRVRIAQGFLMTVYLSITSLLVSLIIGIICAVLQGSKVLILRYLSGLYVNFIRGTPLIMQIYLFYYIVGVAFGVENRFIAGVLVLSIFEGAYIAEIIRGSLLSIDNSQLEAAKSVGFTKKQTVTHVILPQMIARTLPALTGQFASIIKDSSLLSMIAVIELAQTIREITAMNLRLFESYILLGLLYLCLTLPITFITKRLEKRFKYEN